MSDDGKKSGYLNQQVSGVARRLVALAGEAAADPALRARLDAAINALQDAAPAERNTAILQKPADVRSLVRDSVAEELERYWNRRFGGTP